MPELDFSKIVKVFNSLVEANKAIIEDIQMIHKVQMLVVCGVLILSLGSCSREYRIGRLQDRVEMLEERTEENEK